MHPCEICNHADFRVNATLKCRLLVYSTVDSAIHVASAQHSRIDRVDDGIRGSCRDVALDDGTPVLMSIALMGETNYNRSRLRQ